MVMRSLIAVLILCYSTDVCKSAPNYNMLYPPRNSLYAYGPQPRPLGSIGDWITGSSWFPIEINVPDAINSISNGISGITGTISNGISGITGMAQRIPFIHHLTTLERPRPLSYLILVPMQSTNDMRHKTQFNPFAPDVELFPHYP